MSNFNQAFKELIGNEGGFKCEKEDKGDWTGGQVGKGVLVGTKYGLSAGTYPKLDIRNLRLEDARVIYKNEWWDKFQGDKLPYELAFQIFDSEVNHGHGMGVKFLQRALKIEDDGKLGPKTLATIQGVDEDKIILRFLAMRMKFFTQIRTWNTYGRGWANRVADNMLAATE